jgi:hypothetical protein
MNPFLPLLAPGLALGLDLYRDDAHRTALQKLWSRVVGAPPVRPRGRSPTCPATLDTSTLLFRADEGGTRVPVFERAPDGLAWFHATPDAAQAGLRCATVEILADARSLSRPTDDPDRRAVQRGLGFTWPLGISSRDKPPGPSPAHVLEQARRHHYEVPDVDAPILFKLDGLKLLEGWDCRVGRLVVARALEPLHMADIGDLGWRPDILKDYGAMALREGCDGLIAVDRLESRRWGSIDVPAVGLTPSGLARIAVASLPARHHDFPSGRMTGSTPEWEAGRGALFAAFRT